ncbi:hypothetical protein F511_18446 [Dorcoceras hygrometricum]|uniref:Uncharacterized protein n=1 Tax=Dorcoceras hygrometricum TaxID=472368 RepID=A0A2Z7ADU3_9LAMI|nr:hypothetical protein F511_18446 [Dorcoceras hygrometricum]
MSVLNLSWPWTTQDEMVVSTVNGVTVEISEQLFAETFELPVEGLSELSEIPKDLVFDTRSIISLSGEPISTSGKKREMHIEYRLLCDIMANTLSSGLKARQGLCCSTQSLTGNGSKPGTGRIFGVSLFKNLTEKTVHRYIILNEKVGMVEAADAPKVTRAPKKKAASKKRPAAVPVAEPVIKNKRTTKKKSSSSTDNAEMVAVALEAVPIQIIETISVAPAVEPIVEEPREATSAVPIFEEASVVEEPAVETIVEKQSAVEVASETSVQEPAAEHVDEQMAETTADVETIVEEFDEPAVEVTAEEIRPPSTDDVDDIIQQVLVETAQLEATETDDGEHPHGTEEELVLSWGETDSTRVYLNRKMYILNKYREFLIRKVLEARKLNFVPGEGSSAMDLKILEKLSDVHMVVIEDLKEQTMTHADISGFVSSIAMERTVLRDVQISTLSAVSQNVQLAFSSVFEDEDNQMDIDQRLASPTTTADSLMNFIYDDTLLGDDATLHQPSLPTVATNLSAYLDDLRTFLSQHIDDSQSDILSKLNTVEKGLRDTLRQQDESLRHLIQNARQDGRNQGDVQTLHLNEFKKGVLAHGASVTADLMDIWKEVKEIDAKLGDLVDYIRGGDAKKGEGSSSRTQPPPDDQGRGSDNTGGDNVRTTDIVDRFSGSMSREGQNRGRSGGRRSSGNRSGSSKKRHYSSSGGPFRRSFEDWLG